MMSRFQSPLPSAPNPTYRIAEYRKWYTPEQTPPLLARSTRDVV